jgi:hypothetical protein
MTPLDEPSRFYMASGMLSSVSDFDQDGDDDGKDFLTWQRNVGKNNASLADGDADGDDKVSGADLAIWKRRFGVANPLPIDWIEFTHFDAASNPGFATDIYVRSLEVTAPPINAVPEPSNEIYFLGTAYGLASAVRAARPRRS